MSIVKYKLIDLLLDLKDFVLFDILRNRPPSLPPFKLDLQFKTHRDRGLIWVESVDYPGLIASGENESELREAIFDSILTYFDVPRYRARKLPDTLTLKLDDGTVVYPPEPVFRARLVTA
ncbi:MAG: hypothetical protein G01um101416_519 [Microgenomates group bacterium Gr01-1014_16]|nr:MAG: hypothetical protein G01um101416_519 [Microgenomates group bacterium Gr01-1014_16]